MSQGVLLPHLPSFLRGAAALSLHLLLLLWKRLRTPQISAKPGLEGCSESAGCSTAALPSMPVNWLLVCPPPGPRFASRAAPKCASASWPFRQGRVEGLPGGHTELDPLAQPQRSRRCRYWALIWTDAPHSVYMMLEVGYCISKLLQESLILRSLCR